MIRRTYRFARGQLGSVRAIYLSGDHIGQRDALDPARPHVVLLHGFFQTRNVWRAMERRLRADGFEVTSFALRGLGPFNTHPIEAVAARVHDKIERLTRQGVEAVHLVGHSKGGLVARACVQLYGGARIRSVTTLGTPHHGTPTAAVAVALTGFGLLRSSAFDLLPGSRLVRALTDHPFPADVPLTSIYSTGDLVCPWWCSRIDDGANVRFRRLGHVELTYDATVYAEVRRRLYAAEPVLTPPP